MKRLMLLLFLLCVGISYSQSVNEDLAIEIANAYYQKVKNDNINPSVLQVKSELGVRGVSRSTEMISPTGLANMWLVPVDDGWVLVSSNKKTDPILAHFQQVEKPIYEQLPSAAQFMIEYYEEVIAYANDKCLSCPQNEHWIALLQKSDTMTTTTRNTPIVTPLLSVHWGQTRNADAPNHICDKTYNKFCPNVTAPNQCNKAAVGCVAVAIGQIMRYWRWPYAANVPTTPGGSNTEMHFYDWNLMPDSINNATPMNEVDMVASFLKDCGYMVDMDYGVGSGATDDKALEALISFGYSQYTIQKRDKLTTLNWENKIRSDLNSGFPVYYSGMTKFLFGEGHAFVVDGYDSGGLFHINYGWGKVDEFPEHNNTYFDLDVIPNHSEEYFSHHQSAILGIVPFTICGTRHLYNMSNVPSYFNYAIADDLTISNSIFQNVNHGELSSATQVRLAPGVTIGQGSTVRISIREVPHCQSPSMSVSETKTSAQTNAPANISKKSINNYSRFFVTPNPATDILSVHSMEKLQEVRIYNLNGLCLLQTTDTQINVAALPAGLYIVKAQTFSNELLQAKFIKL